MLPSWWGLYGWFFGVAIGGGVYWLIGNFAPHAAPAKAVG